MVIIENYNNNRSKYLLNHYYLPMKKYVNKNNENIKKTEVNCKKLLQKVIGSGDFPVLKINLNKRFREVPDPKPFLAGTLLSVFNCCQGSDRQPD